MNCKQLPGLCHPETDIISTSTYTKCFANLHNVLSKKSLLLNVTEARPRHEKQQAYKEGLRGLSIVTYILTK